MNYFLSTAYLGPVQYFAKLETAEEVIIEKFEHYPKQTYRNRCVIYGANGAQTLTVPVLKGEELKIFTKDVRIDFSMNWQSNHLRSIESAYRCSPFYQYYIDDLLPVLKKTQHFLYDYNLEITREVCQILGISFNPKETQEYVKTVSSDELDFRETIHPKPRPGIPDNAFQPPVYRQVFEPKHGFIPNLSIIDLIFNEGPEAIGHLRSSNQ